MALPKRSEQQYIEIEKFKDYEVTQCIAYEMAIRNPEVKTLVEERNGVGMFEDLTSSQVDKFIQINSYEKVQEVFLSYLKEKPERIQNLDIETKLDEEIKELSFFAIPPSPDKVTSKLFANPFFKSYLEKTSQRNQALRSSIIKKEGLGIKKMFEDDGTALTTTGATINYETLYPKFSRPRPKIPTETSKEIDLLVNLALPTKDMTALVEAIKKVYDKSQGEVYKVHTPLEVASDIDKEIFEIRIKTKKRGSPTTLEMPEKSQQEVYADLIFLYDVFNSPDIAKQGEKIQHFKNEMIDYYADKVCKYHGIKEIDDVSYYIGTPRDQTIREYSTMMASYIDDFGYKKLLV